MSGADQGQALLAAFGRVHVINLAQRADRRREMAAELGRLGLGLEHPQVALFAAVAPSDRGAFPSVGARGCFLSHLTLLERIAAGPEPAGLIVEDDADFTPALGAGLAALAGAQWDIVYGYSHGWGDAGGLPVGAVPCPPQAQVRTSHCIGITRGTAALAAAYLAAMLARPQGDADGGPMHVDGAYNWLRAAHPELRAVCLNPQIARQRPSRTDVQARRWYDEVALLAPLLGAARRLKRRR